MKIMTSSRSFLKRFIKIQAKNTPTRKILYSTIFIHYRIILSTPLHFELCELIVIIFVMEIFVKFVNIYIFSKKRLLFTYV